MPFLNPEMIKLQFFCLKKVDATKLASEVWLYRDQLGLLPGQLSNLAGSLGQRLNDVINTSKYSYLLVLKDVNSLTSVLIRYLPFLLLSTDAMDILRLLPAAQGLVHGTISFASQKLALVNILEEFSKISNDLYTLADKSKALK